MSRYYTTHEPQWETTENGWHAVVGLCDKGYQYTAYIEFADAPLWRIWAGCMFATRQAAQEWCHSEISRQMHRSMDECLLPVAEEPVSDTDAWCWLWSTLSSELGDEQATRVRSELARRLYAARQSGEPLQQSVGAL